MSESSSIPPVLDSRLALASLFNDIKSLANDFNEYLEHRSAANIAILLADVVKISGDAAAIITYAKSNEAFEKFAKATGIIACLGDMIDLGAKAAKFLAPGAEAPTRADWAGIAADVLDLSGNVLSVVKTPPNLALGFSLKLIAWAVGAVGNVMAQASVKSEPTESTGTTPAEPPAQPDPQQATVTATSAVQTDGSSDTYTRSSSGLIVADTWVSATGTRGVDQIGADEITTGKTTYANGEYATDRIDANGNEVIDYYNAAGLLLSDSWLSGDGSSGLETFYEIGLTNLPGAVNGYSVPLSAATTQVNADGSYVVTSTDKDGKSTTINFDSQGNQTSIIRTSGPGLNYTDSTGYDIVVTPYLTRTYDSASNVLTKDSWTDPLGRGIFGNDVFNFSGEEDGKVTFGDGSSVTYSINGNPSVPLTNNVRSAALASGTLTLLNLKGPNQDVTLNSFDVNGGLTMSQWAMADGANGILNVSSGGASASGTVNHTNGWISNLSLDGIGDITIDNYSGGTALSSSDRWNADGTHVSTEYSSNGSINAKYTYEVDGDVLIDSYAPDGRAGSRLKCDTSHPVRCPPNGNSILAPERGGPRRDPAFAPG